MILYFVIVMVMVYLFRRGSAWISKGPKAGSPKAFQKQALRKQTLRKQALRKSPKALWKLSESRLSEKDPDLSANTVPAFAQHLPSWKCLESASVFNSKVTHSAREGTELPGQLKTTIVFACEVLWVYWSMQGVLSTNSQMYFARVMSPNVFSSKYMLSEALKFLETCQIMFLWKTDPS